MADQALDFITIIKDTLLKYWYNIIAIMAPFIVFCIFKNIVDFSKVTKQKGIHTLASFIIVYLASFTILIPDQQGSKKLYYYSNSGLFHCYTGCADPSFDIFELYIKTAQIQRNEEVDLNTAVRKIAHKFGISGKEEIQEEDQLEMMNRKKKISVLTI
jgi:hypothetical protein